LVVYCDILGAQLGHLRLRNGSREIDFIVQRGQNVVAIEVKSSATIKDSDVRHLNWFKEITKDIYNVTKVVVYCGEFSYKRKDGVYLIPAGLLGC
jgi:predicted AAA+ superfamily ATPase